MFIDVTVNLINLRNPPKLLKHKMLTFFSLNITVMDKNTEFGHTDNDCVAFFISSYFVI